MKAILLVENVPYCDPVFVAQQCLSEGMLFLDSAQTRPSVGRYSFLAVDPFAWLTAKNGRVQHNYQWVKGSVFEILKQEYAHFSSIALPSLPPFQGGLAGVFGYELACYLERLPSASQDDLQFPDAMLGFYDLVIAWDHDLQQVWIFSSGLPEREPTSRIKRATKRLNWILREYMRAQSSLFSHSFALEIGPIISTFTPKGYEKAVERVKEYIRAGDIFQTNISQRFSCQATSFSAFALYRRLREVNPAPFSAFMQWGRYAIVSASPERFLRLNQKKVETRPIKGTCKRHSNPQVDEALAQQLLKSEKDKAENIMIVDLMRNDLSRVCLPHTVRVPQCCVLESYATVHHLVSSVEGELQSGYNGIDLLQATFPGGSVTGAPKIRAMEIIAEIEPSVRGPYCGSIGYVAFNGEMDLSITIRTYVISGNQITFQVGGAITIDSDPKKEYEETLIKAKALYGLLQGSEQNVYSIN